MAGELNEIMRVLGRLEEGVKQLRADFDDEKEHGHESRGRIHEKLDHLDESVGISGQVVAQTRDRMDAVEKTLKEDIKPSVDEFKRMKLLGLGALGAVALGAAAIGVSLATIGEQVVGAVKAWLRLS